MSLTEKDFDDTRLARPIAVVDLWNIDDRLSRLEAIEEQLEARENRLIQAIQALENLYHRERVKNWELILQEMLKQEMAKQQRQRDRTHGNVEGFRNGDNRGG